MGEDVQNEHAPRLIVDARNQAVIVTMNVEYGSAAGYICMGEVIPHVGQRTPFRPPSNPIPVHQRSQRIRVPFNKPYDYWLADNPHYCSLQNVNFGSKKADARNRSL